MTALKDSEILEEPPSHLCLFSGPLSDTKGSLQA